MKMMTEGVAIWKLCVWMPSKGEMWGIMKNLHFFSCIENSLFAKIIVLQHSKFETNCNLSCHVFFFRKNPGWQRSMATSFFGLDSSDKPQISKLLRFIRFIQLKKPSELRDHQQRRKVLCGLPMPNI